MCSAFTTGCGYENSTIILTGDVYCPITKCSDKLCMHKKTFQSLGRSNYQCLQCNNSEIHLWLWNVWSLVVCSQSSFQATGARKDDKNRQNTVFFAKRNEFGTQQTIFT